MGRSYFVPRSARGESRILIIFSMKSFITTGIAGLIGGGIWYIGANLFEMSVFIGLGITVLFGGVGFILGTAKIPDLPFMGKFRKAGGEYLSDIIFRFITFKKRKKIYIYNLNRGGK
ncbi:MAG: hypothetical protein RSE00_03920 [Clostridia bacterium]